MLRMCLCTAPSVTNSRSAIARVAEPFGHQRQHLALARADSSLSACPSGGCGRAAGRPPPGRSRVPPSGDAVQRVEELLDPADPLLQQVAEPGARRRESRSVANACSTYADRTSTARSGLAPPGLDRGHDALVGVGRRHPYVDDRDVRAVFVDGGQERRPACRRWRPRRAPRPAAAAPGLRAAAASSSAITIRMAAPRPSSSARPVGWSASIRPS